MTDRPGFNRMGHLTELTLNRIDQDDAASDPAFFATALAHIAECAPCREALEAQRAIDRSVSIAPSPAVRRQVARPRRVLPWALAIGGGVTALAAAALFATRPGDDVLVAKGARLRFEVHVNDGQTTRMVGDGDAIRAGERAAFAVRSDVDGHLLIFGWDDTHAPYAVWPSGGDALHAMAEPLARRDASLALPTAIRFDATPGHEHLAAVFCDTRFALGDLLSRGLVPEPINAPAGCTVTALTLTKVR